MIVSRDKYFWDLIDQISTFCTIWALMVFFNFLAVKISKVKFFFAPMISLTNFKNLLRACCGIQKTACDSEKWHWSLHFRRYKNGKAFGTLTVTTNCHKYFGLEQCELRRLLLSLIYFLTAECWVIKSLLTDTTNSLILCHQKYKTFTRSWNYLFWDKQTVARQI